MLLMKKTFYISILILVLCVPVYFLAQNYEPEFGYKLSSEHSITKKPEVVKRSVPRYPVEYARAGIEGVVILKVLIDENGQVSKIEPRYQAEPHLITVAEQAVKKFKFKPAYFHDQPQRVWLTIPFTFLIRKSLFSYYYRLMVIGREVSRESIREGKYEDALRSLKSTINQSEKYLTESTAEINSLRDKLKTEEAAILSVKINSLDWFLSDLYTQLGDVRLQTGLKKEATEAYLRAIDLDYDVAPLWEKLGWAYFQIGEYEKCLKCSDHCLRKNKNAVTAEFNKALSLLMLDKYTEARQIFRETVKFLIKNDLEIPDQPVNELKKLVKNDLQKDWAKKILKEIFYLSDDEIEK